MNWGVRWWHGLGCEIMTWTRVWDADMDGGVCTLPMLMIWIVVYVQLVLVTWTIEGVGDYVVPIQIGLYAIRCLLWICCIKSTLLIVCSASQQCANDTEGQHVQSHNYSSSAASSSKPSVFTFTCCAENNSSYVSVQNSIGCCIENTVSSFNQQK